MIVNSFVFPGNFNTIYCCMCDTLREAPQTWSTVWGGFHPGNLRGVVFTFGVSLRPFLVRQSRRPAVLSWCVAKRGGIGRDFARGRLPELSDPGLKNSFAFPGNLNTIYCCRLNAGCGAGGRSESKSRSQLGRHQGTARRTTCGYLLFYLGDFARGRLPELSDPRLNDS